MNVDACYKGCFILKADGSAEEMEMQVKTKGNNRTLDRTILLWGIFLLIASCIKGEEGGSGKGRNRRLDTFRTSYTQIH